MTVRCAANLPFVMDIPTDLGKRIGILGGTFDPVHNAHLALAETVKEQFQLDTVLFIPASLPPHKQKVSTSFDHRTKMLQLALEGRDGFRVTKLESMRTGPSFSIDTLRVLRKSMGDDVRFFFIIGMDAFFEIATWKEYSQLPMYANLVVVDRPGNVHGNFSDIIQRDFPAFRRDVSELIWSAPGAPGKIIFFKMTPLAISSTRIREQAGYGSSIFNDLPDAVGQYIKEHGLYRR